MAENTSLLALINAYIKKNGNQEITGPVLNGVLRAIAYALSTPFIGEDGYWYAYNAETGVFEKTDTPAQGPVGPVGVTEVYANLGGTSDNIPAVTVDKTGTRLDFTFFNLKGDKGNTGDPGITNAVVTVDATIGTPSVSANIQGTTLYLAFSGLKGEQGIQGIQGVSIQSVQQVTTSIQSGGTNVIRVTLDNGQTFDFQVMNGQQGNSGYQGAAGELEIVNNLSDGGATKALSAEMGKTLDTEVSQLSQKVDSYTRAQVHTDFPIYLAGKALKATNDSIGLLIGNVQSATITGANVVKIPIANYDKIKFRVFQSSQGWGSLITDKDGYVLQAFTAPSQEYYEELTVAPNAAYLYYTTYTTDVYTFDGYIFRIDRLEEEVASLQETAKETDQVIYTEEVTTVKNTTGMTAEDKVIGSDGKTSASTSYKLVSILATEDMTIWFDATDKAPFTSFLAISTMDSAGNYTPRKRYIAGSEDNLPSSGSPLLIPTGTTLFLNATKQQYEAAGKFTFHCETENVGLYPDKVKAAAGIKTCRVKYVANSDQYTPEELHIYIPQSVGYIDYTFSRTKDDSINCNVWRMKNAFYADEQFGQLSSLTTAGEWECAIKIVGRDDFSGGAAHGDEVFTNVLFLVDGVPTTPGTITDYTEFNEIRIFEESNLYDPADGTTLVAKHTSEHIFNKDGLAINQSILWQVSETLAESYLAMFPVAQAVTDHFCTDRNFLPTAIPAGGMSNYASVNVSKLNIWGVVSDGFSGDFFAEFSIGKYPAFVSPSRLLITNNGGAVYNKCYFYTTLSNGGTTVANGDVWKTETKYRLSVK